MGMQGDKWRELAKRDDVFNEMVPSDLRQIINEADVAEDALKESVAALYGAREVCGNSGNIQHAIDLAEKILEPKK